ncbi:MAG: amidohydrolase [Candidatus Bathyarchaeota archaeon]|nr:amidohydrolase [Candidatus Bathyarchaeota archaeon]
MFADLALLNGKIITVDEKESIVEAVAVKYGRILHVGSNEDVNEYVGDDTKIIDLKGRTVIPGLIDSHCHMVSTGVSKLMTVNLSEEAGVKSVADIQARLAEKAKTTQKGEWIRGTREDDSKLQEKRHPTRWELDEVVPDHPVIVTTVGGHYSIVNSRAFEMAGVSKDTLDPVGGTFERDPNTGELTGGVHEKAVGVVRGTNEEPLRELASEGAKQMLLSCATTGITCVHDSLGGSQLRAVLDLKNRGELPIRVRMDVNIGLFPELNKLGIYQGFGDDWVRITGLKFFFDGSISARTAAVSEPYLHRTDYYGIMATTREIARKTILDAYAAGYRIVSHANGDKAIDIYLDIMEEAQTKFPRDDPRNRVIHCTVVNPQIIKRIKKLGILPTIFGPYPYYHGDKLLPAFGEERLEWMFAARSFLDAGIKIAAHSDHSAAPYPPLMGIHALVNRITKAGKPIGRSQKITVIEALKLYTINGAYQAFDEERLGSIEPGKLADMVVLGEDILTVPAETILDIPIDMTIIEGKTVFSREV